MTAGIRRWLWGWLVLAGSLIPPVEAGPLLIQDPLAGLPEVMMVTVDGRRGAEEFADINSRLALEPADALVKFAAAAVARDPKSDLAFEVLGSALLLEGNYPLAIDALLKAQKLAPTNSAIALKLANAQMAQGDLAAAKKGLNALLAREPGNRFGHQRLAMILSYEGNKNAAIDQFQMGLIGATSDYLPVALSLAGLYNDQGQYAKTIALLEPRLVALMRDAAEGHLILGEAYLRSATASKAVGQFNLLQKGGLFVKEATLGAAIAYRQSGDLAQARQQADDLVKLAPDFAPGQAELAEIAILQQDWPTAEASYQRAVALGMEATPIYRRLGQVLLGGGESGKARDYYQRVIAAKDADSRDYVALSEMLLAAGDNDQAKQLFVDGLKRFGNEPLLLFRYGALLASLRDYPAAVVQLAKAERLQGDNPAVVKALCLAQAKAGDNQGAAATAGRLLALQPDQLEVRVLYATRLQAAGELAKAEEQYRQILGKQSDHLLALNNLANLYLDQGKFDQAEPLAAKAHQLAPDNGLVADTLGWSLYRLQRLDEALPLLVKAQQQLPDNATIHYHLGVAYAAAGQAKQAQESLTLALAGGQGARWQEDARQLLASLSH